MSIVGVGCYDRDTPTPTSQRCCGHRIRRGKVATGGSGGLCSGRRHRAMSGNSRRHRCQQIQVRDDVDDLIGGLDWADDDTAVPLTK
ncbi:hypothetical protein ACLOJK_035172 [Asimina triloba]